MIGSVSDSSIEKREMSWRSSWSGGGVQSITLAADGHTVATYSAACNFAFPQPCPLSTGPQTLELATSSLTDGTHALTLVATDAAGNESTVASEQVTIDNNPPPPPPTGLAASATQPGGSTFTTSWMSPADRSRRSSKRPTKSAQRPGLAPVVKRRRHPRTAL